MIIDNLIERSIHLKNPMTIALNATLEDIPQELIDQELEARWATPKAASKALFEFNSKIIDALAGVVPAITINFSSYLLYGPSGVTAYRDTIKVAQDAGVIIISDGDFSGVNDVSKYLSTSHLGSTDIGRIKQPMFDVDFITTNPFYATGGIDSFIGDAKKYDKGIFVAVRTCDKGTSILQDEVLASVGGTVLWEKILEMIQLWGDASKSRGEKGYHRVGAIVGMMHQSQMANIRKEYLNIFFYVPGNCKHHAPAFNDGKGAIIENSTAVRAHKDPSFQDSHWLDAIRMSAVEARNAIRTTLNF